jgi:Carboxypeptidase regulatory-like domain
MKWRAFVFALVLCLCGSRTSKAQEQPAALSEPPKPETGIIVGTVTDVNNGTVPGATVALVGPALEDPRTVVSNDNGFFQFKDVEPGTYAVTVGAQGFANWTSPPIILKPGQYEILTGGKLRIAAALTTITVASPVASPEEIAAEQVKAEEQQRIFGFIPNFYVVYDHNAAPLTTKLKFKLAVKVIFDPVTVIGVAGFAGINQAADNPNYGQGAKGYAERFGAGYADGFTDIMVGGAILPSLLHQDPRYFYQGTGTNKSRALHALSFPFVCRGDNGRLQPNYSTLGGDLASAAIANAYYPASNRGVNLLLGNFFIYTGQRALADLAQEFILRRLTPKAKNRD